MSAEFEDIFSRLTDKVDEAAAGSKLGEMPDVEGMGTAHDERITVKVRQGQVRELEIQPLAMRLSNVDLAEKLTAAVNDALGDYAEKITEALSESSTDFVALGQSTRKLREDSLKAMKQYTESLFDALNQVKRYE